MEEKECEEYYRYKQTFVVHRSRFYYRDNAALVEIYYERLSTDYLRETEAYGVNKQVFDHHDDWSYVLDS